MSVCCPRSKCAGVLQIVGHYFPERSPQVKKAIAAATSGTVTALKVILRSAMNDADCRACNQEHAVSHHSVLTLAITIKEHLSSPWVAKQGVVIAWLMNTTWDMRIGRTETHTCSVRWPS